eukprot:TRINITY_DN67204_c2_g1_i1.p1 TRINITY_DN67204_c2_g1~~TRINITY_DN67204_c2_g1_i1.p1  ORF type:complete len:185 (+),score=4.75 TRINITY_DN67204_c2_g1_i1:45-557(+)
MHVRFVVIGVIFTQCWVGAQDIQTTTFTKRDACRKEHWDQLIQECPLEPTLEQSNLDCCDPVQFSKKIPHHCKPDASTSAWKTCTTPPTKGKEGNALVIKVKNTGGTTITIKWLNVLTVSTYQPMRTVRDIHQHDGRRVRTNFVTFTADTLDDSTTCCRGLLEWQLLDCA